MTTIDRVSTPQQTAYLLGQITKANAALNKTNEQIASGNKANSYAGFGSQTQMLQATISANARNSAYTAATTIATTQTDIQDTQLDSLSNLAALLRQQLFVYRDLFTWLDHPFQPPPPLTFAAEQIPLSWSGNLDSTMATSTYQPQPSA